MHGLHGTSEAKFENNRKGMNDMHDMTAPWAAAATQLKVAELVSLWPD